MDESEIDTAKVVQDSKVIYSKVMAMNAKKSRLLQIIPKIPTNPVTNIRYRKGYRYGFTQNVRNNNFWVLTRVVNSAYNLIFFMKILKAIPFEFCIKRKHLQQKLTIFCPT